MRFISKFVLCLCVAGTLASGFTDMAQAQFGSSTTSGVRGSGSTSSTMSSGFGTSASGQMSAGLGTSGLTGGARGGQAGQIQTGIGTSSPFGSPAQQTQNGFLGGRTGANQQQNFVGRNQRTQAQNLQQGNQFGNRQGGRQNRNNQNDQFNGMDGFNAGNQNATEQRKAAIRPQQKVAFEVPVRSDDEIRTSLQSQYITITQNSTLGNVTCELDADGVATLRGSVATNTAKQLAANVVRMEPGVRKVRNELAVGAAAAE